ncbi:MAG: hypothetical protein QXW27_05075 [Candidatus Methanomethylicaceae archaeon]
MRIITLIINAFSESSVCFKVKKAIERKTIEIIVLYKIGNNMING